MVKKWLVLLAISLEVYGLQDFFSRESDREGLIQYLMLHGLASALLSLVLVKLLPERYRTPWLPSALFLFSLQFAIPFIGIVGVFVGIVLALYLPRSNRKYPWSETTIPDLPFKPNEVSLKPLYSQGGLRQVLRESNDTDKRLKAVLATKRMKKREAIEILQNALSDKVDDVRLLAYSMLDGMEKEISTKIVHCLEGVKSASKEQRAVFKRSLAQNYWEMSYLGLAKGGVRRHFLNSAKKVLEELLEDMEQQNPDNLKIKGRVHLALEEYDDAISTLYQAVATGLPRSQVLPYLAEAAFYSGEYDHMLHLLEEYSADVHKPDMFTPVLQYWLKNPDTQDNNDPVLEAQ
ncbi:hypothetical protein A9Q99_00480 [Gammaproteobacteria bacterium 45_16_T64]|nr:hypothetical protein A9Q99_00480 [Gammaproteobacteria bacterium 45_16_T64]